jgi:hypothetical protein
MDAQRPLVPDNLTGFLYDLLHGLISPFVLVGRFSSM